jgi:signal transduction histidine kinase
MNRRHWPAALILIALVIFASYLLYTEQLVREIRATTALQTRLYGLVQRELLSPDTVEGGALQTLLDLQGTLSELRVPIVILNTAGRPYAMMNLPFEPDASTQQGEARIQQYARSLARSNVPVVVPNVGTAYFGSPPLVGWLRWIPWFQVSAAALLILVALAVIGSDARAERERMWAAMARELAHQMGTPLSSLSGWVEILQLPRSEQAAFATPERVAGMIDSDVERLSRVSRRFEMIGKQASLEPVDPREVISELVQYITPRLPQLGSEVELRVRAQGALPSIKANQVLLVWALENLVKNALDALAGRGGQIIIGARAHPDGWVRLLVSDDGPGIPVRLRARIFDPGVSTKSSGWGVGLSLTRRIVEEIHHGCIRVRPRLKGGTVFEILLPLTSGNSPRRPRWNRR